VVKAAGTGLADMRACRVVSVPDESQMLLFYRDSLRTVEQLRFNGHIVAVLRDDNDIEWTFPAGSSGPTVPDSPESPGRQRC
jgi:hypothetical protein